MPSFPKCVTPKEAYGLLAEPLSTPDSGNCTHFCAYPQTLPSGINAFNDAWTAAAQPQGEQPVSRELKALVSAVYFRLMSDPFTTTGVKEGFEDLLQFLAGAGRTTANCRAV